MVETFCRGDRAYREFHSKYNEPNYGMTMGGERLDGRSHRSSMGFSSKSSTKEKPKELTLEEQVKRLQEALKKYGTHTKECESHHQDRNTMGMGCTRRKCNCGFDKILKGR